MGFFSFRKFSLSLSLSQIPNPNPSLLAATTTKLGAIVTRNPRGGSGGGGGVSLAFSVLFVLVSYI